MELYSRNMLKPKEKKMPKDTDMRQSQYMKNDDANYEKYTPDGIRKQTVENVNELMWHKSMPSSQSPTETPVEMKDAKQEKKDMTDLARHRGSSK